MKFRSTLGIAVATAFLAIIPFVHAARASGTWVSAAHQTVDAKELYLKHCKECHGVLGAPTKAAQRKYDKIPNFTDPEFFKSKKDADLVDAVGNGKGRDMKGFAEKLNKEEIKALVEYVRTLEKKG
jgi:mono/diheme cytochrome c family protein